VIATSGPGAFPWGGSAHLARATESEITIPRSVVADDESAEARPAVAGGYAEDHEAGPTTVTRVPMGVSG